MGFEEGFTKNRNFITNPHMDTPPEIDRFTGKRWKDEVDINSNGLQPFHHSLQGEINVYDVKMGEWKILQNGRIINRHNPEPNTSNEKISNSTTDGENKKKDEIKL